MRQLIYCCPGTHMGSDIYASMRASEPEPRVGTLYGVTKDLSPSGTARLLGYRFIDVAKDFESSYPSPTARWWSLYLLSIPEIEVPDDPCDSDFMEEIST